MNPAPYPADTRAKGWRFELDLERIRQSDTWALASLEARPWLLMMWATAWEQTPCGSLPNDDTLIAARIGMTARQFEKQRAVLLRGWQLHDDGRLYHATIAQRVVEMLERRRSEADRKAAARARKLMDGAQSPAAVHDMSRGTTAGLHPESDTGTGTSTSKETPPNPRKRGNVHEFPPGFESFWSAYPRKTAKPKAAQAFARLSPDAGLLSRMLAAVSQQARSEQWTKDGGQFIPHPASWLNARRWEDQLPSLGGTGTDPWDGAH